MVDTPYPTWRETLHSKEKVEDWVVPWVAPELLVGVWIILKKACLEGSLTETAAMKEKWNQLRCRLTHLIPDASSAAPDPFWAEDDEQQDSGEQDDEDEEDPEGEEDGK